jgi:putative transposase
MPFYPTQIRLAEQKYRGRQIYFVTMCCEERKPVFEDISVGQRVLEDLAKAAAANAFLLRAFCLMPDHVHVLAEGLQDASDLLKFVNAFKQFTGFKYKRERGTQLWQTRFYDHILRSAENVKTVAFYIWCNPVRKGICESPHEYALSGSQTIDWKIAEGLPVWSPPWKREGNVGG